jgi:membrane protein insertase Oxa1/YidC/SpoIIIJ
VRLRVVSPPPAPTLSALAFHGEPRARPALAVAVAAAAPLTTSASVGASVAAAVPPTASASLDASADAVALAEAAAAPVDASAALAAAVSGLDAGFPAWPTSWLSYGFMHMINGIRTLGGMEWWSAIVATSVALRVVTVPPALYSQRTSAWFGHFKEEIAALTARIRVANEASDREAASRAFQDYQAFMRRNKLSIVKGMLAPIISQAFVFISMFSALRWLIKDAALVPEFLATAPLLLTVPDPTYSLTLTATVFTISSVLLNQNVVGMPDRGLSANGQKLAFSGISIVFSGITAFMPAVRVESRTSVEAHAQPDYPIATPLPTRAHFSGDPVAFGRLGRDFGHAELITQNTGASDGHRFPVVISAQARDGRGCEARSRGCYSGDEEASTVSF